MCARVHVGCTDISGAGRDTGALSSSSKRRKVHDAHDVGGTAAADGDVEPTHWYCVRCAASRSHTLILDVQCCCSLPVVSSTSSRTSTIGVF